MKVIIDQRIVIDAESYEVIGAVMDSIAKDTQGIVNPGGAAAWKGHADFVGFQTRPCKAAQMDQLAYDSPNVPMQALNQGAM